MARAYIALGANLGDRLGQLRSAVRALGALGTIAARSAVWETAADGPPPDYMNAAIALDTTMRPLPLLEAMHAIEAAHGRRRAVGAAPNLPRTLDLDLLLLGDRVIETDRLVVPHPRMHERAFVLSPLVEIAADVVHPLLHCSMRSLLEALPPGQRVRRLDDAW